MLKKALWIITLLAFNVSTFAKSLQNTCAYVDNMLAKHLAGIYTHAIQSDHYNPVMVEINNQIISVILKRFSQEKDSLACHYKRAKKEGLYFLSSDDNHFRVYAWDTATGGTMHNFDGFIQYVDANNAIHVSHLKDTDDEEPLHAFPTSLFSAQFNGKPHYMLVTTGVFSTMQYAQSLTLYRIDSKKLMKPALIKTRQGLTSQLGFGFNLFSLIDSQRNRELFEYDRKRKRLRFPVVINNTKYPYGEVTKRWIQYQFDGRYFKRIRH